MLLHRLRQYGKRHDLWRAGTAVVVAVSGGSDSVAMLRLLHQLHQRGELQLAVVAHLDHAIRDESASDAAWCAALAQRLGLPFAAARVDVPAQASAQRQSVEVAGRQARLEFLEQVRHRHGAALIATAHTEDDQAETVLLRLLRGAGRRGAAGIAPQRGPLIRPLLWASRAALRDELGRLRQEWRDDRTNADLTNPRNRVRHELLPYLEANVQPAARQVLARFAETARIDERFLEGLTAAAIRQIVQHDGAAVRLAAVALETLDEAIATRVVRHALRLVNPQTSSGLGHVKTVMAVARGEVAAADVPGVTVEHSGHSVVLVRRGAASTAPAKTFAATLPIPGRVRLEGAKDPARGNAGSGWVVEAHGPFPNVASTLTSGGKGDRNEDGIRATVTIAADDLGPALQVRNRQPGDWLQPLGLNGRKKVHDVLVDRKVPRRERDRVPIVTDRDGRILWVAGHAIGEAARVSAATRSVLILNLRRE